MPLSLVVGPAHAGKVALLLERFLAALDRDPWLIVPNRAEVDGLERDLLRRRGVLLGGRIGTFEDLFTAIAGDGDGRRVVGEAERALAVRRAVAACTLDGLAASSASPGFVDALQSALAELESALVDPETLDGDLGRLYRAYRAELERVGAADRGLRRRRAVERIRSELTAWAGSPVLAYGFEDLTAAEWSLLEALAARAEVVVSMPYEPGRTAFASLSRTVGDLAALAGGRVEELSSDGTGRPAALAHVERALFEDAAGDPPPLDGALRLLEGAGARGALELVGEEILSWLAAGTAPERIGIVCDSVDRWRAPLDAVLEPLGITLGFEEPARLGQTPLGRSLLALLRFAWLDGDRDDLFAFLHSPFCGLGRHAVDFVEGRLRGRAVHTPERVEREAEELRGGSLPLVAALREPGSAVAAVRSAVLAMARNAHGLDAPPASESGRADLRAAEAVDRLLDELAAWEAADARLSREDVAAALERAHVRGSAAGEPGVVAVLDLMRARTRDFEIVVVLGLEEGALPRRGRPSPFLDEDRRRALGRRLERPDPVSRDRYLFYTACTRASRRLVLVREAVTDDGSPREPGPFWEEVTALFDPDDVRRATRRRPLSALTWELDRAPTERERLRALARLAADDEATAAALAEANGWQRRLERAARAFDRPTRLRNAANLAWLAQRRTFGATELERFADCSSAWLFERVVDPKRIDAEPDAMLRGQVAHTALHRFYQGLPRELGVDRVTAETLDRALEFLRRSLDAALETGVRLELTDLQAAELRQSLVRDLEAFVRDEALSGLELVPRRFEVAFGSERAAPELQRGLALDDELVVTGKIDRIDVDPFAARGIVQDYKSGKSAHSARDIDRELRLQIPLYMLVLRDLVGIEPLGGVYRPLSGKRVARGMLRAESAEDLAGFSKSDYLDEESFWAQIDTARERALRYARRIRAGDVRHDPKGEGCPAWCDLWPMCRVERS